jgi:RNA polymerase sigma-70 factor (ECF subfamily)
VDRAEDLTQGFFAMILEKRTLANADPQRGRFRAYLLGTLKNYLAGELDKAHAAKRGGGRSIVAIDARAGEDRYRRDPLTDQTPERLFDRQWALTAINISLAELRARSVASGKQALFDRLLPHLTGDGAEVSYQCLATELGTTEGALKLAAHRMRRQYGQLLREQIARTLRSPDEIEDEIRHLFAALRS